MKKKKLKKSIAVLLTAAITLSNFSGIGSLREVQAATTVKVENGGFESTTSSNGKLIAKGWSKNSSAEVVSTGAKEGSKCLKMTNPYYGSTYITQELTLNPNTEYVLTGYIKGENIRGVDSDANAFGNGTTIEFEDNTAYMVEHTNNWQKGTFDWKKEPFTLLLIPKE
ncbi:MAG: hypothetical protein IJA36_07490 [Lachnospiraceae bacterium]|nr:hypothetical protein [Lachnospiraceae bacterium]